MKRPLAVLAALLLPACGQLKETQIPDFVNPPGPSLPPPPSGTLPPIAAPSPTPGATPAPGASPTPAATPTPSATPPPASASCQLPPMPECGAAEGPPGVWGCCREESSQLFEAQVDQAIAILRSQQPQLFAGDRVLNDDAYVQGVARVLEQRFGLCARQGGPADEIGVKSSNSWSEQYDILYGSGHVRTGGYTVTCRPARF